MPGSLLLSRLGVLLFVPCFPVLVSCVQTPPGARVAVPPSPHWCVWRSPCLRAQVPWDVYWTLPFCPQAPLAQSCHQGWVGCVGGPCGDPSPPTTLSGPPSSRQRTCRVAWVISYYGPLSSSGPQLRCSNSAGVTSVRRSESSVSTRAIDRHAVGHLERLREE